MEQMIAEYGAAFLTIASSAIGSSANTSTHLVRRLNIQFRLAFVHVYLRKIPSLASRSIRHNILKDKTMTLAIGRETMAISGKKDHMEI